MTHTEATVPTSIGALEEIAKILENTGYADRVRRREDGTVDWISMTGLRLGRASW